MRSILTLLTIILFIQKSWGRPEYALRYNFVNCATCHVSPTGGEIRNISGKLFGSHGYPLSQISEEAKWFQLDYRAEAFQQKNATTRKGLITMTATPSANLPVQFEKDKPPQMNFVVSYGLGRLFTGLGDTYVRYNMSENPNSSWFEHILVGRFLPPYGLLTDEHRTYTKLATLSSMRDYETGFMLSGTPSYYFHYDLAATNGLQTDIPAVNDSPWALFINTRTIPFLGPFMFGASYSRHGTHTVEIQPEAFDFYTLFSLDKLTNSRFPLTFISEIQWAHGWNNSTINSNMSNFIPTSLSSWQDALNNSRSRSVLLQANWNVTPHWILLYRFEQFTPDTRYGGDQFYSYGYGIKWFMNAQSSLQFRFENASSTRPGIDEDGTVRAVGKTAFFFFHFWL